MDCMISEFGIIMSILMQVSAEGCERYDLSTGHWTSIAEMPYAVNNCSLAACFDKIFCIGSSVMDNALLLQVYSPKSGMIGYVSLTTATIFLLIEIWF